MTSTRTVPIDLVGTITQFAHDRGWDLDGILVGAGVSPMLLRAEKARITEEQLISVVQEIWRVTGDEMLGIGRHPLPRGTFRLLCYALLGANDLRGALDRLSGFLQAIPAIPVELDLPDEGDDFAIVVTVRAPTSDPDQLALVVGLSAATRLMAWMLRRNLAPSRVDLPFSRPADTESLKTLIDGPLTFDADRAAVVLDRAWLGAPIMRDERDIEELVSTSPRALLTRPRYQLSLADQVRRTIEAGLRKGAVPSAEQIADRLAMSPQTLRRRLAADEDLNVREIIETVRRDAAITALVQGDEPVADLSMRLGFSDQSTFTRAFRRWTGSTPSAYRRQSSGE